MWCGNPRGVGVESRDVLAKSIILCVFQNLYLGFVCDLVLGIWVFLNRLLITMSAGPSALILLRHFVRLSP
jgi:hypothetical protein